MTRIIAILQLLGGGLLAVAAAATLVNLLLIVTRPETISVVNAMIGQGLLIICLAALSRILIRKGWRGLFHAGSAPDSAPQQTPDDGDSGQREA